jgi:CDP-diglyceride synthetase
MITTCKVIRLLGLLGAAWIGWSILIAMVVSTQYGATSGASMLRYSLTVTVPNALLVIFLCLPYSKMKGGLWRAAFALLCLSGTSVCLYLVTHLSSEDWLMISGFLLFFLSQPVAIWLSQRKIPNQREEQPQ